MIDSETGYRLRILTCIDWYLPGVKGGGSLRSVANMVEHLPEFQFKVITRDRDLGDTRAYSGISIGKWSEIGGAQVCYVPPGRMVADLATIVRSQDFDCYYLNSYFSPFFGILPFLLRAVRMVPQRPWVVAPRGEFSPGAFQIKRLKKATFVQFARLIGLQRSVLWQASSAYEAKDIRRTLGASARIAVAPDLGPLWDVQPRGEDSPPKEPGSLRAVFISRLSPKKNLDGALRLLQETAGDVNLDIYGPIEDINYWEICQGLVRSMPPNVTVAYRGELEHAEVKRTFGQYHLFLFPTHGENFGHVILESLAAGCPVLISDQTPWRNLREQGCGWDLPLSRMELFRQALHESIAMDADTFRSWSAAAVAQAQQVLEDREAVEQNRQLFHCAVEGHAGLAAG